MMSRTQGLVGWSIASTQFLSLEWKRRMKAPTNYSDWAGSSLPCLLHALQGQSPFCAWEEQPNPPWLMSPHCLYPVADTHLKRDHFLLSAITVPYVSCLSWQLKRKHHWSSWSQSSGECSEGQLKSPKTQVSGCRALLHPKQTTSLLEPHPWDKMLLISSVDPSFWIEIVHCSGQYSPNIIMDRFVHSG